MRHLLLLPAFAVFVAQLHAQTTGPMAETAATISATDVARHIGAIAADSMMGRGIPSRGVEMTARYVADQFKRFGLKPGGDNGTWFQHYPVPDDTATAPNTVGILEGSDPELKNEYVVFSAHMDHVGFGAGGPDSIHNGADDNGSGTAGIVELAEAFSRSGARPRRSLIFLAVSGEENGLWGSTHFVEHPSVPLEQLVANINLDMIGRGSRGAAVWAVGRAHSDLGAVTNRVNAEHPELEIALTDPPEVFDLIGKGPFGGSSDHLSFAIKGVPVLCFSTGLHSD